MTKRSAVVMANHPPIVMAGLDPAILLPRSGRGSNLRACGRREEDGRVRPGHDGDGMVGRDEGDGPGALYP